MAGDLWINIILVHLICFSSNIKMLKATNLNITVVTSACDNGRFPNCNDFKIFICPDPPMFCRVPTIFDFSSCMVESDFNGFDVNMGFGTGNNYDYTFEKMITPKDRLYVAVMKPASNIYVDSPVTLLCQSMAMTPDQEVTLQDILGKYRLSIVISEIFDYYETTMAFLSQTHRFSTKIIDVIATTNSYISTNKRISLTSAASTNDKGDNRKKIAGIVAVVIVFAVIVIGVICKSGTATSVSEVQIEDCYVVKKSDSYGGCTKECTHAFKCVKCV